MQQPKTSANNPKKVGKRASKTVFFGELKRFAVYAVHTRFDCVCWFVTDAEKIDPKTGFAEVIRQEKTFLNAVKSLNLCN